MYVLVIQSVVECTSVSLSVCLRFTGWKKCQVTIRDYSSVSNRKMEKYDHWKTSMSENVCQHAVTQTKTSSMENTTRRFAVQQ